MKKETKIAAGAAGVGGVIAAHLPVLGGIFAIVAVPVALPAAGIAVVAGGAYAGKKLWWDKRKNKKGPQQ